MLTETHSYQQRRFKSPATTTIILIIINVMIKNVSDSGDPENRLHWRAWISCEQRRFSDKQSRLSSSQLAASR